MSFSIYTRRALFLLVLFHLSIIIISNYLVQYPVEVWGIQNTWGAFTFPFVFLATDLTVRIFGARPARIIIFWVMLPALFVSYTVSSLFYETQWQGWSALSAMNIIAARIALASFLAYSVGQLMDIFVFNRLRQYAAWWIAPAASMFVGNLVDTMIFFFIAFFRSSDAFMAENWIPIAWADYGFKLIVCFLFFLPAYGMLLKQILKRLAVPHTQMQAS